MKRKETQLAIQLRVSHMATITSLTDESVKINSYGKDAIAFLGKSAKLLCLYHSNFCCENCSSENDLTIHHLIERRNRHFMDYSKYLKQRHYFGNQIILCAECHCAIEKRDIKNWKGFGVISKNTIKDAKQL